METLNFESIRGRYSSFIETVSGYSVQVDVGSRVPSSKLLIFHLHQHIQLYLGTIYEPFPWFNTQSRIARYAENQLFV